MFIKRLILIAMILCICVPSYAASLVKLPTQEQIKKLCVPVVLSTDGDVHWFYYKHIKELGDGGISIVYGKRLSKVNHFAKDQILNFDHAKKRYEEIKRANE